ncbi:MAG: class I SAM-dependent methyltransferase [Candidatus Aureabacteria bacterium]|nr:class I SAM-dependent methyltransferase [Candidatus Auribacterota bacterium]
MTDFKVDKHWQENYDSYYSEDQTEWRRLGAIDKAENILSFCKDLSIRSLIDIGAGEGAVLQRLSELGFAEDYYCVEISTTGVDTIKKRNIRNLKECKVFDGYSIPYDDKRFDLSILSHVIEHAEHPRKLLTEAKRAAKYVFIEVPLEDNMRLPDDFVMDKVGHINFYSAKTIRRLLQTCGLKVLKQKVVHASKAVYAYRKSRMALLQYYLKENLLRFFPKLAGLLFTYHCAILCSDQNDPTVKIPPGSLKM